MPRKPRDLGAYIPALDVADELVRIAQSIRERADLNPLVAFNIRLRFWNPDWEKPHAKGMRTAILTGLGLRSPKAKGAGR